MDTITTDRLINSGRKKRSQPYSTGIFYDSGFPVRSISSLCSGILIPVLHGNTLPSWQPSTSHWPTPFALCWQSDNPVPQTRHSTLDDSAFPVVAAHAWNNLLPSVTVGYSIWTSRHHLKLFLTSASFRRENFYWSPLIVKRNSHRDCVTFTSTV